MAVFRELGLEGKVAETPTARFTVASRKGGLRWHEAIRKRPPPRAHDWATAPWLRPSSTG